MQIVIKVNYDNNVSPLVTTQCGVENGVAGTLETPRSFLLKFLRSSNFFGCRIPTNRTEISNYKNSNLKNPYVVDFYCWSKEGFSLIIHYYIVGLFFVCCSK